jgi:hypothetical protein
MPNWGQIVTNKALLRLGLILVMITIPLNGWPQQASSISTLNQLEQSVYGQVYSQLPDTQRLDRLENTLFYGGQQLNRSWVQSVQMPKLLSGLTIPNRGVNESIPMSQRIERLQSALGPNSPQSQTLPSHQPFTLLGYLEQRLLNTQFKTQPIDQRLSRLETLVFGQANTVKYTTQTNSSHNPSSSASSQPDLSPVTLTLDNHPKVCNPVVTNLPIKMDVTKRLERLLYAVPLDPQSVRLHIIK